MQIFADYLDDLVKVRENAVPGPHRAIIVGGTRVLPSYCGDRGHFSFSSLSFFMFYSFNVLCMYFV